MNPNLSKDILELRSKFLFVIRNFFAKRNYLEMDTPKLKKVPGMEPFLSPFEVNSPDHREKGYLVTSPEYSLKQVLGMGIPKVYEISQVYRSGESGGIHTAEFLLLEFYEVGIDEFILMDICTALFGELENEFRRIGFHMETIRKISVPSLFREILGISDSRTDLEKYLSGRFPDKISEIPTMRYEELFFLVFLNDLEPHLGKGIVYLYDYPAPLASLAKIEGDRARRFEIYWSGLELGNAFYECTSVKEMEERFLEEQEIRRSLGKEVFPMDSNFMNVLASGIPECSGIAIGLDRLFMTFLNHSDLKYSSPYFGILS